MGTFVVEGGKSLSGTIEPQGAKNEALQILCAVLLTADPVEISNVPDIVDINKLFVILQSLGVSVEKKNRNTYIFQANNINLDYLTSEDFKKDGRKIRGSIMLVGPLLTRFGKGYIPRPGGDKIGRRRVDTHFEGFVKLGADFNYDRENHFYTVEATRLKGAYLLMD